MTFIEWLNALSPWQMICTIILFLICLRIVSAVFWSPITSRLDELILHMQVRDDPLKIIKK